MVTLNYYFIMNFYLSVSLTKTFFQNICKKCGFWGQLPFNIYRLWSELCLQKHFFFKSRLYMPQSCGVEKKSGVTANSVTATDCMIVCHCMILDVSTE